MPTKQTSGNSSEISRIGKRALLLGIGVLLLVLGNKLNDQLVDYAQDIIRQCGIAIILAVSLNIVNGLTGQFSIGHAGFMAVGAYTGASVTYFVEKRLTHYSTPGLIWMLPAMLAGGLLAALFGYLVGVPSLRLRGDYLAIVTLGFGEIIRVLIENSQEINANLQYLGGATGFSGDSGAYSVPRLSGFILVFGTAAAVVLLVRNLKFSSHGLAFMSVREDEIAADAMGVNTTNIKVTAFVMSAFCAGVGGVLFAHALYFKPQSFSFILSMNYVIMVVLGGTGSITGATMAAIVLTALPELLKPVQDRVHFADEYRLVIYALLLVLMMMLRPSGVFGMGELSLNGLMRRWRKKSGLLWPLDSVENTVSATLATPEDMGQHYEVEGASNIAGNKILNAIVLDTKALTRRFGGLTAVSEVNVTLRQGELVGLIGPNGAGKTTLFNLLTGVYEPSQGEIEFKGAFLAGDRPYSGRRRALRVIWDGALAGLGSWIAGTIVATAIVPTASEGAARTQLVIKALATALGIGSSVLSSPRRMRRLPGLKPFQFAERGISRTFQNIRLFGELTVLENVRLATYCRRKTKLYDALLRTRRIEREEAANIAKACALLVRFNLIRVANETAKNLPYGDQRRLEIVRALATDPSLLLLDEPAAGMNPQEKTELMSLIRQVRDEFGLTILLIEHDMKLVMGICERIYVLDYGRIIAEGTPQQIQGDSKVIAAYLGEELEEPAIIVTKKDDTLSC